jgi:hypothetical protein
MEDICAFHPARAGCFGWVNDYDVMTLHTMSSCMIEFDVKTLIYCLLLNILLDLVAHQWLPDDYPSNSVCLTCKCFQYPISMLLCPTLSPFLGNEANLFRLLLPRQTVVLVNVTACMLASIHQTPHFRQIVRSLPGVVDPNIAHRPRRTIPAHENLLGQVSLLRLILVV